MKFLKELILPLLGEISGRNDQAALQVAADDQLLKQQARHDRLSCAGVICQYIAQWKSGQHLLIDGRNLMRKRLNRRCMHGKIRIKQMRKVNAVCFGYQALLFSIHIKAPGETLFEYFKRGFVFTVQNLRASCTMICLEDHFYAGGTIPFCRYNSNRFPGKQTMNDAAVGEVFKPCHAITCFLLGCRSILAISHLQIPLCL